MSLKTKIEEKIFEKNYSDEMEFPKKNMLIEVANCCNNSCIFCANRLMTRKRRFINSELVDKVLKEAYILGMREVGFYATGEALLNPELENYVLKAKEYGYSYIYITTNGILANVNRVESLYNCGLKSIKYSINATNEKEYEFIHGTNNFKKVLQNLREVYLWKKDNNIDINIFVSYILTRYTDKDLDNTRNIFNEICDEFVIIPVRNQGGIIPKIDELLSCDRSNTDFDSDCILPCNYPFNSVIVTCEGYLTACCMDFQNYLAYADLNNKTIKEAWNCDAIRLLRKQHIDGNVKHTICDNCINNTYDFPAPLVSMLSTEIDFSNVFNDSHIESRVRKYYNK